MNGFSFLIGLRSDHLLEAGRACGAPGWATRIKARLNHACFEAALRQMVAENDLLRLRFHMSGGRLRTFVEDAAEVGLEYHDFSAYPDPEAASAGWMDDYFGQPTDLDDFPLFRFAVAKLHAAEFVWMQACHPLTIGAMSCLGSAALVAALYDTSRESGEPAIFKTYYRDEALTSEESLFGTAVETEAY